MLMQPWRGNRRTSSGSNKPYAATTITSGACAASAETASGFLSVCGFETEMPRRRAAALTALSLNCRPRPAGVSGRVVTPTTRCRLCDSASRAGTENCGVPANTTRRESLTWVENGRPQMAGTRGRDSFGAPEARCLRSFSSFLRMRWRLSSER